ncbi:Transaminated amino acid decarboxylase [Cyberlindnera fabianii]|uniref:Transaminated amino acid decarboxylase n=1 Tax=Cyberlindnera fabianii TaxID=36022 RepID=A0A1V2LCN2_CYBFA|nr:Transaminated amino acid decarboxylase [Cyberlindnera fabianii]
MAPIPDASAPTPTTITTSTTMENNTMKFGEYLFKRLAQVHSVNSIFGVPGDFNLGLLDHLYTTDLQWIGGCNELNSGYSADGYSRYTNSLGVLITTYGVGELSAINAVAGAFAEYSKVLHIVGIPTRRAMFDNVEKKKHLHHLVPSLDSLEDSDHFVYTKMVGGISCIAKTITNPATAAEDVDEVIKTIFKHSRPGYLFLPLDMADEIIDASRLITEPAVDFHRVKIEEEANTKLVGDKILSKLYNSKIPAFLADVLVRRYDQGVELLRELVNTTNIHNYTTFMGKSILNEYHPSFVGDYIGIESNKGVKENLESSDCILYFGPHINEINTGHYSFDFTEEQSILLHPDYIKVGSELFRGVHMINVMRYLLSNIDTSRIAAPVPVPYHVSPRYPNIPSRSSISQSVLLKKFESFLQEGDVVVCETGSFMFGIPDFRFKTDVNYIAQGFYLSIGMALPCSVGVGIAMKDQGSKSRLILVEGDGSAQMTIQELSSFPHYGLKPIIFLLNNSGYTVERIIRGENQTYNDIKPWNWSKVFELFEYDGTAEGKLISEKAKQNKHCVSSIVSSEEELSLAMTSVNSKVDDDKLRFFEVILDKLDCPWRFFHMNNYRLFPLTDAGSKALA